MGYLLISSIILIIILFVVYIGKNAKLSEESVPSLNIELDNISICKEMLKIVKNYHTRVEYNKDENSNLSYYNHSKDVIILKKSNCGSFRITQIAHECIHTLQNIKYLKANKFFSNLQLIYFVIALICIIMKRGNEFTLISVQLLVMLGTLFAKVVIEGDATYRSVDLAEIFLTNNVSEEEARKYIAEMRKLVYNLMPIYYMNFLIQGMSMIVINMAVAMIT